MKQYTITAPTHFDNTVLLPASKSISNRSLIIHALSNGEVKPQNLSDCDDTQVILDAITHMPKEINVKAAGTAMRFLTAYLAVTKGEHIITGTDRMKHRPIGPLVDSLRYMGADIEYLEEEGFPPLKITGKEIDGGQLEIPGSVSSQYISALLMIGPVLKNGLELTLTGTVISRPYIDLTLWTMQQLGAKAEWSDVNVVSVKPYPYQSTNWMIESDWSAASYWYETLALSHDFDNTFFLQGLLDGSKQGDSVLRYIFSLLGVKTSIENPTQQQPGGMRITRHMRTLPRLDYDFTNSPDLAQTFVVCCSVLNIPFHFTGLSSLLIKETDRIKALITEMLKLGYVIEEQNNSELIWNGLKIKPTLEPIETYEDHRMAMSFAPASIRFPGLKINHPEVVSKSYPHFWDDLKKVGFIIEENDI
ncbi:MAG: 3-phosphoshikimate 1-carboxyvinyltransferase [Prevotella sp.]